MKHKHHIIPKHMGGTDDPSNLIELTVEEHADAHKKLFEKYGKHEDFLAWQGLSGMMTKEEIIFSMLSEAGKRGAAKGNQNRKGTKYKPYKDKDGKPYKPIGTIGRKWYHNPLNPLEKKCFLADQDIPEGWVIGQGKKSSNPGLNFKRKK